MTQGEVLFSLGISILIIIIGITAGTVWFLCRAFRDRHRYAYDFTLNCDTCGEPLMSTDTALMYEPFCRHEGKYKCVSCYIEQEGVEQEVWSRDAWVMEGAA